MNLLGNLLAGGVLGIGLLLMIRTKLRQAEVDRARADSLASWIGGKQDATAAENSAAAAEKSAAAHAGVNPLDW
jgi:hypothetical protein